MCMCLSYPKADSACLNQPHVLGSRSPAGLDGASGPGPVALIRCLFVCMYVCMYLCVCVCTCVSECVCVLDWIALVGLDQ